MKARICITDLLYFPFLLTSLFFIVGSRLSKDGNDNPENELGLLEFIHNLVETMDKWAGSICELDIMYQLEQVHFLLDEMVMNGYIVETNKMNVLRPLDLMERESQKAESMYRWFNLLVKLRKKSIHGIQMN